VMRDGLIVWSIEGEDGVQAFDDVVFPLALGREGEVSPAFSTDVVEGANGYEMRSARWDGARTAYDVGPGVRGEADVAALLAFFRARRGPARAFRLRDPFDHDAQGVTIGIGDGVTRSFALVKRYGDAARRITRPVAGSVGVAVDGRAMHGFSLAAGGVVTLDDAPVVGAIVTATFSFDVAVRFAEDRLSVSRATYLAGEAASVPLVEVREA